MLGLYRVFIQWLLKKEKLALRSSLTTFHPPLAMIV